jgi:hypothetical protein
MMLYDVTGFFVEEPSIPPRTCVDCPPPAAGTRSVAVAPGSLYGSPTYTTLITPRDPLVVT